MLDTDSLLEIEEHMAMTLPSPLPSSGVLNPYVFVADEALPLKVNLT